MVFPDGTQKRLPMSQRRSLLDNPDRQVRKAAFDGGNAAWQSIEDTAAGALNAIAGTRLTLNRHRGVDHFLDIALFQAAITRKTLDAMFEALMANLEIPRRILQFKARLMGRQTVAWYDLGAPLDLAGQEPLSWEKAQVYGRRCVCARLSGAGRFFPAASDRQKLGRLGAARRQTARRLLHQLHAEQRIAHLYDLQRIAG